MIKSINHKHDKISVVIVNYNSIEHTLNLLSSLRKIKNIVGEIIIINNSPKDIFYNSKYKGLKICNNSKNLGFAKAINQGIKLSKYQIILTLNPDTTLIDDTIKSMFDFINCESNIGAIGGKIIDAYSRNNKFTANSKPDFFTGLFEFTNLKKIFPNNIFSNKFWIEKNSNFDKPVNVNSLCGAFLMFRKKINNHLNLFDENFFLYLEDVDFGTKINKQGYKVIYYPYSSITHVGGASSKSIYKTELKEWYKSRKYYFKKNISTTTGAFLSIIYSIEEKILSIYHSFKHEPSY